MDTRTDRPTDRLTDRLSNTTPLHSTPLQMVQSIIVSTTKSFHTKVNFKKETMLMRDEVTTGRVSSLVVEAEDTGGDELGWVLTMRTMGIIINVKNIELCELWGSDYDYGSDLWLNPFLTILVISFTLFCWQIRWHIFSLALIYGLIGKWRGELQ